MPSGLITLPLRLGIRGASLALGVTERVAGLAWEAVEQFVPGRGGGTSSSAPERPFPRTAEPAGSKDDEAPSEVPEPERDPRAEFELGDPRVESREPPPAPEPRAEEPPPSPAEPPTGGHVDTEATFVESFAEPGAEDSVGAQVRIDPPWEGYEGQTAEQIIGQLDQSSAEALAAIELYEATHKGRATVLAAVERQLKARTTSAGS